MRIKRSKAKLTIDEFIVGLLVSLGALFSIIELARDLS
jgi:hypothetical protein